jgi:hypothetical protein
MTADDGSGTSFERSAKWLGDRRPGRTRRPDSPEPAGCVYWIVSYAFRDQYARAHTRAGLLLQVQEMIAGEGGLPPPRNARTRPHHGVLLISLPDQRG